MRIRFADKDSQEALQEIKDALGGRKLGKIVSFDMQDDELTVTIKKMGKSTLEFSNNSAANQTEWELTNEKIALAHKPFRDEMIQKLTKVVHSIGGEVTDL